MGISIGNYLRGKGQVVKPEDFTPSAPEVREPKRFGMRPDVLPPSRPKLEMKITNQKLMSEEMLNNGAKVLNLECTGVDQDNKIHHWAIRSLISRKGNPTQPMKDGFYLPFSDSDRKHYKKHRPLHKWHTCEMYHDPESKEPYYSTDYSGQVVEWVGHGGGISKRFDR